MAGKSACLHGLAHDCTPFRFTEVHWLSFILIHHQTDTAVEYFGQQLRNSGYNYFGHERFYSGVNGLEFEVICLSSQFTT